MGLSTTLKSSAASDREPDKPTEGKRDKRPHLPDSMNRARVLDSEQAANFLGISLPHFRRLYRAKRVPSPITIGYRKYGWQAGVLIDFVAAKTGSAQ